MSAPRSTRIRARVGNPVERTSKLPLSDGAAAEGKQRDEGGSVAHSGRSKAGDADCPVDGTEKGCNVPRNEARRWWRTRKGLRPREKEQLNRPQWTSYVQEGQVNRHLAAPTLHPGRTAWDRSPRYIRPSLAVGRGLCRQDLGRLALAVSRRCFRIERRPTSSDALSALLRRHGVAAYGRCPAG